MTIPDVRDLPKLDRIPPIDKKSIIIAALIALCYITYITSQMLTGNNPSDGLLLGSVIGSIAFVGGYNLKAWGDYYRKR